MEQPPPTLELAAKNCFNNGNELETCVGDLIVHCTPQKNPKIKPCNRLYDERLPPAHTCPLGGASE
jgi:hypothetical protein